MYQLGLVHHEEELLTTILSIYRSIGFEHDSLSQRIVSPLENPGVVTTVAGLAGNRANRSAFVAARSFALAIFVGLPLASQMVIIVALGWWRAWWWTAPVLVSWAMSLWLTFLFFSKPVTIGTDSSRQ
jgi:hypothetical protein